MKIAEAFFGTTRTIRCSGLTTVKLAKFLPSDCCNLPHTGAVLA
ncbi:hypothetical protein M2341_002271 [Sphingobium sp. B7D2B]|nr:hypothetical protein [Sphingobium sp. B7D2B]